MGAHAPHPQLRQTALSRVLIRTDAAMDETMAIHLVSVPQGWVRTGARSEVFQARPLPGLADQRRKRASEVTLGWATSKRTSLAAGQVNGRHLRATPRSHASGAIGETDLPAFRAVTV